jgi:hypothetical protein
MGFFRFGPDAPPPQASLPGTKRAGGGGRMSPGVGTNGGIKGPEASP